MKEEIQTAGKLVSAFTSISNPTAGLVGSACNEALSYFMAKKTNKFLEEIDKRLTALESTGILELNELVKKERFLELLITACHVAHHTQRKEKIARIKNAVISCAINDFPENKVDSIFHLFDQLSEEHFIILEFLSTHSDKLREVSNITNLYGIFNEYNSVLSKDAFGHYLYDLKYRRLVRLSDTVSDEEGLKQISHYVSSEIENGETIIVSEVAKELLKITE